MLTSAQKRKLAETGKAYSMLWPNFLLFCFFSLFPVVWTLRYMFCKYGGIGTEVTFVGLQNFMRLFRDKLYFHSVLNTFKYAFWKIIITIPLSFFVAYILAARVRGNGLFQSLIFLPTIMSSAVMGLVFFLLFNAYNGEVNHTLLNIGFIKTPVNWLGAEHAMQILILVAIWGAIGNYMVYFIAGIQQIPRDVLESAEIDGATGARKLWFIVIPMMGPILKIILMLAFANAFNDINTVLVLTEGGPFNKTMVMTLYAYKFFFPVSSNDIVVPQFGYGAAVSFISACIAAIVTVLFLKGSKKVDDIY